MNACNALDGCRMRTRRRVRSPHVHRPAPLGSEAPCGHVNALSVSGKGLTRPAMTYEVACECAASSSSDCTCVTGPGKASLRSTLPLYALTVIARACFVSEKIASTCMLQCTCVDTGSACYDSAM